MDNNNLPPSEPPAPPAPPLLTPPPLRPPPPLPRPTRKRNGWKVATLVLALLLLLGLLTQLGSLAGWILGAVGASSQATGPRLEEMVVESADTHHKIAIVPVEGMIWGASFDLGGHSLVRGIQDQLKAAGRDPRVKAVILKINSPGGEVLASDDINRTIADFQKKTGKPVVAALGSLAASGGYYVAASSRWIVANELTITGSIGVMMHGYNYRGLMNKIGLQPQVYKSGRFKDMLSGEKDLEKMTAAERADFEEEQKMVQGLIDQTYQRFKQVVEEGRRNANRLNQNNKDDSGRALSSRWADYADGRVISGKQAYELGFVDELGAADAAVKRARQLAGIAEANLVTYRQVFDLLSFFNLFGKTDAAKMKVDWGVDLPRLEPGHLYLLSPTYLR